MENPAKKARIDNKEDAEANGAQATIETAVELEHEDGAKAPEQEAVEEQELDEEELDAEEIVQQEELNTAMAALEDVQERIRGVKEEAIDRILAIEQEVNRECQPMYRERAEAMSRIPNFWKFVLMQHALLQNFIMEDDQDVLDYLEQIVVEENADVKSGYTVKFAFNENPFFSNSVLEKKVYYREDGSAEVTGVQPQWHPGKNLTQIEVEDPEQEDGSKILQAKASFFQWFEMTGSNETEDEIADIIREQIWPNPLQLYYGEGEVLEDPEAEALAEDEAFGGYEEYDNEDGGIVEYLNEGEYQDQLDEQELEGGVYPDAAQLDEEDYYYGEGDPEGGELVEDPGLEYVHGEGRPEGEEGAKAADEEMMVAAKNAADQEAAVPQEEAVPAAPAS